MNWYIFNYYKTSANATIILFHIHIVNQMERMIIMSEKMLEQSSEKYPCNCQNKPRPCYECEYNNIHRKPPQLISDCVVVNSLLCNKSENIIAELSIPIATLGDIISIGPGGVI